MHLSRFLLFDEIKQKNFASFEKFPSKKQEWEIFKRMTRISDFNRDLNED